MPGRRRLFALLAGTALAAVPGVAAITPASAAATSVALVGDLQSEVGCSADWDPTCAASELRQVEGTDTWKASFSVAGGTYQFKVALNDGWAENYGAGGVADGPNIPLVIAGPATIEFAYDDQTHQVSFTPVVGGGATSQDRRVAGDSRRDSLTRENFYFVMADRFANGSTANDRGGLTGGPLTTGYDPTNKAFYHGGDLKGLTSKLDYLTGLGTTAIWLTPSFTNKPVQGAAGEESAGYHGYWITDFTQIDPHLGTNADMKALIDAAHSRGMKVFFDIITNHTADVIDYREGTYGYQAKASAPYRQADGTPFDDRDYVNETFPEMSAGGSFPYTPFVRDAEKNVKVPAWLNDPLMYHNRGDSTFAGESSTYGDFIGLDDLFTERPEVVEGMGDIYKTWVDFGIDGFRIDTVKHVNLEFWQKFIPDILGEAKRVGNDDFFAFGEVFDGNPEYLSQFTTAGTLQATLDFGFQQQGVDFAKGNSARVLADFFAKDDWYTDADSNAYQLPTFLGNHDMGRASFFLKDSAGGDEAEHLERVRLANSLMYLVRGNPVTYYGDEQGFVGTGGDQLARQDMFASRTQLYNDEAVLGGADGARDRYDPRHPLYRHLASLAAVRTAHPTLADGAQVQRYAADGAGVFALSRVDRTRQVEYLVAVNNSEQPATASFDTWTQRGTFEPVFGSVGAVTPSTGGQVTVTVPPLSVGVWQATKRIHRTVPAPTVSVTVPEGGASGRVEIGATVDTKTFAQTTFLSRPLGATEWTTLGTDDNAPFRVYHDVSAMPLGTVLEYRAVTKDARGKIGAASNWARVVEPPSSTVPESGDPPATQPGAVSVPGTHNSEMGCSADWLPDCAQAQLALDADDQIWKKTVTLTPGGYGYKAALNGTWTENYGAGGIREGANIDYETDGTVTFFYDPTTHWITADDDPAPIVTASGSFQSELGCPADFTPDCMRPWLQDKDGDGVFAFQSTRIPAGTYEFVIAHDRTSDTVFGEGGAAGGAPIAVTVPADGATTTIRYDVETHQSTVTSQ
ncbi:MAG: alpha-amylase family glycosyl hydrolase [Dermatophilaceae bacterium]